MPSFNPDLFKLAREERGLSQKALAEALKVVQSEISKVESGKKVPGEEFVGKAAAFFGYTPAFFSQADVVLPEGGIRHRKRSALSATDRARIEAEAKARMLDASALAKCQEAFASDLPARDGRDPAEMARFLRRAWSVPSGPIDNLPLLVERHKVLILAFDFGTDLLDAFALPQPDPDAPVCIAFNTNPAFPPDRHRFTLAHELGHVVLHRDEFADESDEKRQEEEANEFAGEFLAPESDIREDLSPPITFARLRDLKAKWKMSMGALVHRAQDIGLLKPAESRRIWFLFGRYGYRKREPGMGLAPEKANGIRRLLDMFRESRGDDNLPAFLHLAQSLFEQRYGASAAAAGNLQGAPAMT